MDPSETYAAFRDYLRMLALIQIARYPNLKIEPSDIVQQTMLNAHRAEHRYTGTTNEERCAWLRQFLVHTLADALKYQRREMRDPMRERSLQADLNNSCQQLIQWVTADQTTPSLRAERNELLLQLASALERMPAMQREAVIMRYCHGKSLDEIGQALEKGEKAVSGLLHRGLQSLRDLLRKAEEST